jgi:hypothetical protein
MFLGDYCEFYRQSVPGTTAGCFAVVGIVSLGAIGVLPAVRMFNGFCSRAEIVFTRMRAT